MISILREADSRLSGFDLESLLKDWELRAIGPSAVLMIKGAEIHCAALKDVRGKWISRKAIRENLSPLLEKHGKLTTKVMNDNLAGQEFVTRIGFIETGRVGDMRLYELKELRHA